MTIATIRRRIKNITAALRPAPDSLAARIERLGPDGQEFYEQCVDRQKRWQSEHPDINYFGALLDGDVEPMPNWFLEALTGQSSTLSDNLSVNQVQSLYSKMVFGE